jgi:hypothetical protein
MLAFEPRQMYLTHFGPVGDVQALGIQFLDTLDAMVALGRSVATRSERHEALRSGLCKIYLAQLDAHGCEMSDDQILDLLALDIELNAQGMGIWLDRRARRSH